MFINMLYKLYAYINVIRDIQYYISIILIKTLIKKIISILNTVHMYIKSLFFFISYNKALVLRRNCPVRDIIFSLKLPPPFKG